jgi:hypothetical protein
MSNAYLVFQVISYIMLFIFLKIIPCLMGVYKVCSQLCNESLLDFQ